MHSPFDLWAYDAAHAADAHTRQDPASVRDALRSLFRRVADERPRPYSDGPASAGAAAADAPVRPEAEDGDCDCLPALPSAFEVRMRKLRANAHAAFRSVQGSEEAAIDAALAVIEAEWLEARDQSERFAEALKHVRLYSADGESRQRASRSLAGLTPADWAAQACGCGALRHG